MRRGQAATQVLVVTGIVLLIALAAIYGNREPTKSATLEDLTSMGRAMDAKRVGSQQTVEFAFAEGVERVVFNEQSARVDLSGGEYRYIALTYQALGEITRSGEVPILKTPRGVCFGDKCAEPLIPLLECVEETPDGYLAHFGYENKNAWTVQIPAGEANQLIGGSELRPPTIFTYPAPGHPLNRPGRSSFHPDAAFSVAFDGSPLAWTLTGPDGETRSATASANSAQC